MSNLIFLNETFTNGLITVYRLLFVSLSSAINGIVVIISNNPIVSALLFNRTIFFFHLLLTCFYLFI